MIQCIHTTLLIIPSDVEWSVSTNLIIQYEYSTKTSENWAYNGDCSSSNKIPTPGDIQITVF